MGAMYEPQNNGPHTLLAATINDSQTSITVADATILPAAPNVLTIGTEEDAELVLVESKTGNILTVQRGFNGTTPKAWNAETWIYRAITAQDIQELQKRTGYIVRDLTADELAAMDTAVRATLYADGARVLKVTNGETVVLLTLNAEGAVQWAGGEMPRELLDNCAFEIAQAGYLGNHGANMYLADRWKATSGEYTVSRENGVLTITNTSAASGTIYHVLDKSSQLLGKTVTLALCTGDNEIFCKTATVPDAFTSEQTSFFNEHMNGIAFTLYTNSANVLLRMVLYANQPKQIRWVRLVPGEYTAETLPPPVPRRYVDELTNCQQYFHLYSSADARPSSGVDCSPPMRIASPSKGTVDVDGVTYYYNCADL